jgi:hypothetical protein
MDNDPLGDIDYSHPLDVAVGAAIEWMRELAADGGGDIERLGTVDARHGRAMSFLLRLCIIDAEQRGRREPAQRALELHRQLWRRYSSSRFYGHDNEAELVRRVVEARQLPALARYCVDEADAEAEVAVATERAKFASEYPSSPPPCHFFLVDAQQMLLEGDSVAVHYRDVWRWALGTAMHSLRRAVPTTTTTIDEWLADKMDSLAQWSSIRQSLWVALGVDPPPPPVAERKRSSTTKKAPASGKIEAPPHSPVVVVDDPCMKEIRQHINVGSPQQLRTMIETRMLRKLVVHLKGEPTRDLGDRLEWGQRYSFKLWMTAGSKWKAGSWKDFESGDHGGLFDLVIRERRLDAEARLDPAVPDVGKRAYCYALRYCAVFARLHQSELFCMPPPPAVDEKMTKRQRRTGDERIALAVQLWERSTPLAAMEPNDPRRLRADAYFCRLRGIWCWPELETSWRFAEHFGVGGEGRFPAIVCPMVTQGGAVQAIHGLVLSQWDDGRTPLLDASKRTLGVMHGAAIFIGGDPYDKSEVIWLCEGPEDGLSVLDGLLPLGKDDPLTSVLAIAGKSNHTHFVPPPSATTIIWCGDDDGHGEADALPVAAQLARRLAPQCTVRLVMPTSMPGRRKVDFNDLARSFATAEAWRAAFRTLLATARVISPS